LCSGGWSFSIADFRLGTSVQYGWRFVQSGLLAVFISASASLLKIAWIRNSATMWCHRGPFGSTSALKEMI
jgi:hypothetical protein